MSTSALINLKDVMPRFNMTTEDFVTMLQLSMFSSKEYDNLLVYNGNNKIDLNKCDQKTLANIIKRSNDDIYLNEDTFLKMMQDPNCALIKYTSCLNGALTDIKTFLGMQKEAVEDKDKKKVNEFAQTFDKVEEETEEKVIASGRNIDLMQPIEAYDNILATDIISGSISHGMMFFDRVASKKRKSSVQNVHGGVGYDEEGNATNNRINNTDKLNNNLDNDSNNVSNASTAKTSNTDAPTRTTKASNVLNPTDAKGTNSSTSQQGQFNASQAHVSSEDNSNETFARYTQTKAYAVHNALSAAGKSMGKTAGRTVIAGTEIEENEDLAAGTKYAKTGMKTFGTPLKAVSNYAVSAAKLAMFKAYASDKLAKITDNKNYSFQNVKVISKDGTLNFDGFYKVMDKCAIDNGFKKNSSIKNLSNSQIKFFKYNGITTNNKDLTKELSSLSRLLRKAEKDSKNAKFSVDSAKKSARSFTNLALSEADDTSSLDGASTVKNSRAVRVIEKDIKKLKQYVKDYLGKANPNGIRSGGLRDYKVQGIKDATSGSAQKVSNMSKKAQSYYKKGQKMAKNLQKAQSKVQQAGTAAKQTINSTKAVANVSRKVLKKQAKATAKAVKKAEKIQAKIVKQTAVQTAKFSLSAVIDSIPIVGWIVLALEIIVAIILSVAFGEMKNIWINNEGNSIFQICYDGSKDEGAAVGLINDASFEEGTEASPSGSVGASLMISMDAAFARHYKDICLYSMYDYMAEADNTSVEPFSVNYYTMGEIITDDLSYDRIACVYPDGEIMIKGADSDGNYLVGDTVEASPRISYYVMDFNDDKTILPTNYNHTLLPNVFADSPEDIETADLSILNNTKEIMAMANVIFANSFRSDAQADNIKQSMTVDQYCAFCCQYWLDSHFCDMDNPDDPGFFKKAVSWFTKKPATSAQNTLCNIWENGKVYMFNITNLGDYDNRKEIDEYGDIDDDLETKIKQASLSDNSSIIHGTTFMMPLRPSFYIPEDYHYGFYLSGKTDKDVAYMTKYTVPEDECIRGKSGTVAYGPKTEVSSKEMRIMPLYVSNLSTVNVASVEESSLFNHNINNLKNNFDYENSRILASMLPLDSSSDGLNNTTKKGTYNYFENFEENTYNLTASRNLTGSLVLSKSFTSSDAFIATENEFNWNESQPFGSGAEFDKGYYWSETPLDAATIKNEYFNYLKNHAATNEIKDMKRKIKQYEDDQEDVFKKTNKFKSTNCDTEIIYSSNIFTETEENCIYQADREDEITTLQKIWLNVIKPYVPFDILKKSIGKDRTDLDLIEVVSIDNFDSLDRAVVVQPYFETKNAWRLNCDIDEHTHGDGHCNATNCSASCILDEHTHGDGHCNLGSHVHNGSCCSIRAREHVHGDGYCNTANCSASCILDEHTHGDGHCDLGSHVHNGSCCSKQVHTHEKNLIGDSCYDHRYCYLLNAIIVPYVPEGEFAAFALCGGHTQVSLLPIALDMTQASKNIFDITFNGTNATDNFLGYSAGSFLSEHETEINALLMTNGSTSIGEIGIDNRLAIAEDLSSNWQSLYGIDYNELRRSSNEISNKSNFIYKLDSEFPIITTATNNLDPTLSQDLVTIQNMNSSDPLCNPLTADEIVTLMEIVEEELGKTLDKESLITDDGYKIPYALAADDTAHATSEYINRKNRILRALDKVGRIGYTEKNHSWVYNNMAKSNVNDLIYRTDCSGFAAYVLGEGAYGYRFKEGTEEVEYVPGYIWYNQENIGRGNSKTFNPVSNISTHTVIAKNVPSRTFYNTKTTNGDYSILKPGDLIASTSHIMVYLFNKDGYYYTVECPGESILGNGGVVIKRYKAEKLKSLGYYWLTTVDFDLYPTFDEFMVFVEHEY